MKTYRVTIDIQLSDHITTEQVAEYVKVKLLEAKYPNNPLIVADKKPEYSSIQVKKI